MPSHLILIIAISLVLVVSASPLHERIEHIVVLMLENRAFDHFFGRYPGVDGLSGFEYNLANISDANSERIYVSADAPYANLCDPDHSLLGTTYKMYGMTTNTTNVPPMTGFVEEEVVVDHFNQTVQYCNVMQGFSPDRVPVISALASQFVLMDHFFASVPGPTWPNRAFFLSGTSLGMTETDAWYHNHSGIMFPMPTIYDQVAAAGGTWVHYYHDSPWELFMTSIAEHPENVRNIDHFFEDARRGTFPDFSFINPRCGINITTMEGSNDDHPDHDVALGEKLIRDVYAAIRASPAWEKTLFILTFDEHGGFYDHVPPPTEGVPPPDNSTSYPDFGFHFDRLGMRIPTILVSPWVPKGYVKSWPSADQKPTPTSQFDLTSIIATSRKILKRLENTTALTKRDAWSATFDDMLLLLDEPRRDCVMELPHAPTLSRHPIGEARLPVNGLQRDILTAHAHAAAVPFPHHLRTQDQVSHWLQDTFEHHRHNVALWKESKHHHQHPATSSLSTLSSSYVAVHLINPFEPPHLNVLWNFTSNYHGVWILSSTFNATEYCLTYNGTEGATHPIYVSRCFPNANPSLNRDTDQQWSVDNTTNALQPLNHPTQCLTSYRFANGSHKLITSPCTGSYEQAWGYGGTASGITPPPGVGGYFNYGPFVLALVLETHT